MGFFDFLIDPVGATVGSSLGMKSPSDMLMGGGGDSSGADSGALGGLIGGAAAAGANKEEDKGFDPTKTGGVPQTKFNQMRQKQLGMGGS